MNGYATDVERMSERSVAFKMKTDVPDILVLHQFLLALAEFRFLKGKFRSLVGRIAYAMVMGKQVRGWGALKKMANMRKEND